MNNIITKIKNEPEISIQDLLPYFNYNIIKVQSIILKSQNSYLIEQLNTHIIENIINSNNIKILSQLFDNDRNHILDIIKNYNFKKNILIFLVKNKIISKVDVFIKLRPHIKNIEKYISKAKVQRRCDIEKIINNIYLSEDEWNYIVDINNINDVNIMLSLYYSNKVNFKYQNKISWEDISTYLLKNKKDKDNILYFLENDIHLYFDIISKNIEYFIKIQCIRHLLTISDIEYLLKNDILPDIKDINNFEYHRRIIIRYLTLIINDNQNSKYIFDYYINHLIYLFNSDVLNKSTGFINSYISLFLNLINNKGDNFINDDVKTFLFDIFLDDYFMIVKIRMTIFDIFKTDSAFQSILEKNNKIDKLYPPVLKEYCIINYLSSDETK